MSTHVLGDALARAADEPASRSRTEQVREEPGQGIEGWSTAIVAVGSRMFVHAAGISAAPPPRPVLSGRASGEAHVLVGIDGHLAGVVVMADEPRPEAAGAISRLRTRGSATSRSSPVIAIRSRAGRRELGSTASTASSRPEQKLEIVRALRERPVCARDHGRRRRQRRPGAGDR